MSKKQRIDHAPIVKLFAARLRERRVQSGLTQAELANAASVAATYVSRLEAARVAPGIDMLDQLATALGTTPHDLLPLASPPDTVSILKNRSRTLLERVLQRPERELIQALVPILARLAEGPVR
ncbi:MAG TPA: helix-turn-helix transcriptional regulator [Gemmataceae bacterium]|jgi:transcriptional regulator with XRE-family HTH domain|nr:helix-turn-helix transcriptional regulator [Gemmataceae bacterium]